MTQDNICVLTCDYQSQPGREDVGRSQVIQRKGRLSQLQLDDMKRLVESGESNVEAQQ